MFIINQLHYLFIINNNNITNPLFQRINYLNKNSQLIKQYNILQAC